MITSSRPATPAEVAGHYDELDSFYREVWGEHVHHGLWLTGHESREEAVHQLAKKVACEAGAAPGRRVCDIGCGYGATARLLAHDHGALVTALTLSPAQHAFAQSRATGDNPAYLLGDWLENTLPPSSFDAAIAIESTEHMPGLGRFFQQAARVLRPGGQLVVCAWLARPDARAWERRWLLEPICREGRMPHMGTAADYCQLAEEEGFVLEGSEDLSRQVAPTWPRIVGAFLAKLLGEPRYLRFLINAQARNRVFALTIFRLCLAYRAGAMRYGIFTWTKGARL